MERLSREDRLMLWPDDLWPQDIGVLAILESPGPLDSDRQLRVDRVRDAVADRLHLLPRLRQQLLTPGPGFGPPLWIDAVDFDLDDHVRVASVAPPGDETQLLRTVAGARRTRLDPLRPLWEMHLITGLAGGRVGLFIRMHHVVADGMAGIASLGVFMDTTADVEITPAPVWEPAPPPTRRELLADNLRQRAGTARRLAAGLTHPAVSLDHFGDQWSAARELFTSPPGPATSMNRLIGDDRTYAVVRTRLDTVRHVAHAHDAKINDVLLTAVAGGLTRLLHDRGELPGNLDVPIYVPISLRRNGTLPQDGNLISQMVVHLPLGDSTPEARLRQIAVETERRKQRPRPPLGAIFRSRVLSGLMLKPIARQRINVETANLPGPATPLYLAGAEVLEILPLLNLIGNVTLGVGALSYNSHFDLAVTADRDTYPDLDRLVVGIDDELHRLVAGSGTSRPSQTSSSEG